MGQAKQRGTYEERKALAIKLKQMAEQERQRRQDERRNEVVVRVNTGVGPVLLAAVLGLSAGLPGLSAHYPNEVETE
jgi:hypothetical protein